MTGTNINEKILTKLEKFSQNPAELKMCKELLAKELLWFDIVEKPFKRDFLQLLNLCFPFKDDEND